MSKGILYINPNLQQMYCVDFQKNEIRIFEKKPFKHKLAKIHFFCCTPPKKSE